MSEFNDYLARIRSALEVKPKRAEEICAEVRSHLEERAAQLVESGMSREEAVARAVQTFGDPQDVALRLTQANSQHRPVSAPRLLLGFALASVALLSAFDLTFSTGGGGFWLDPALQPATSWAREQGVLLGQALLVVMTVVVMAPAAVLAGIVAGPRRGWIAGLPALLWGALLVVVLAAYDGPRSELFVGPLVALVAAPASGLMGLAGSRALRRGRASRGVAAGCAAYLVVLGLTQLFGNGWSEGGALFTVYGITLVVGVLVSAALWQSGNAWRAEAVVVSAYCAVFLAALIRVVQLSSRVPWFDLAALAVAGLSLGLLAALWMGLRRPSRRVAVLLSTSCVALVLLVIGISVVSGAIQWFEHPEPIWVWRLLVAAEVAVALGLGAVLLTRRPGTWPGFTRAVDLVREGIHV